MNKLLPKEQPSPLHQEAQSLHTEHSDLGNAGDNKELSLNSADWRRTPQTTFPFVQVGDLEYQPPDYIIEELLETDTLGLFFGEPGCGKSFLAVDIGLSVASGTPFHGRDVKQGPVFLIAGEGHKGLVRRFTAWSEAMGVPLQDVPLFMSKKAAHFLSEKSAQTVSSAVSKLAEQHGPPALIIIDTLARNFGAGDENSTKDMNAFVATVDELKACFPGVAVLIVHHSGHGEKHRARGSMALKGALDAEYRVEKDGDYMRLVNTKMKDAAPPSDLSFSFRQVEFNDGNTSAVLDAIEAPQSKHRLTATQRLATSAYTDAAANYGKWDEDTFLGVHVEDWRTSFYSEHTGDNIPTKQKAFQRARKCMTDNGLMKVDGDVYLTLDANLLRSIKQQADGQDIAGH